VYKRNSQWQCVTSVTGTTAPLILITVTVTCTHSRFLLNQRDN